MNLLSYLTIGVVLLPAFQCYNILLLAPFNGPSHWLFLSHFIHELDNRGHSVTAITGIPLSVKWPAKYTEILIDPPFDLEDSMPHDIVFQSKYASDTENIHMLSRLGLLTSDYGLKDTKVKKLIDSNDQQFDLIFAEQFFQESWLMFAHKFRAPIVSICTYGTSDFLDRAMGHLTPWSHVPHFVLTYTDDMSFQQRLWNVYVSLYDAIHRSLFYLPAQNKLARKHFGHLEKNDEPLPTVEELERSISVILINCHRSITSPRPTMPGIVSIGGAHIKPPKALPADLQNYLDNAKDGVIYFSLGAYMKSANMPTEKIAIFIATFGKLKQRVIWKFEDDNLDNLPPNVLVRKWLPQNDILAHKNVRLFISHGGMFGNFEGIERGVPMLFIPLFGDQHRNAMRAEQAGYAKRVSFAHLTVDYLHGQITELIDTKQYYNRAKEVSTIFRDNPLHPMNESMFWIEYVARHKGAKHLKSHAVNMSWAQYLLLDILGLALATLLAFYWLLSKVARSLCLKRGNRANKKQKRN